MTVMEAMLLALAGLAAGGINAVVGSGSLVTFPVLLAMGYPPVLANVTNNIGVLPGSLRGSWAYWHHLAGQGKLVAALVACSTVGGTLGAILLLNLPAETFNAVVPVLIIFACLLVLTSPWIKKLLDRRKIPARVPRDHIYAVGPGSLATAVYGGYFGAAQGIILLSVLSTGLSGTIHRANAFKNLCAPMSSPPGRRCDAMRRMPPSLPDREVWRQHGIKPLYQVAVTGPRTSDPAGITAACPHVETRMCSVTVSQVLP